MGSASSPLLLISDLAAAALGIEEATGSDAVAFDFSVDTAGIGLVSLKK